MHVRLGMQALIVDYNQLGHLPAQIGSLERLETLSCSHNLLLSLPASIGNLKALKFLDCSSNKIVSLPLELGNATAVEEINASDNYLQVSYPSGKRRTLGADLAVDHKEWTLTILLFLCLTEA